jgi:hypothetical protein
MRNPTARAGRSLTPSVASSGGYGEMVKATSRTTNRAHVATCGDCGCLSSLLWAGWGAYHVEDPSEAGAPPALAFFCPACAAREMEVRSA